MKPLNRVAMESSEALNKLAEFDKNGFYIEKDALNLDICNKLISQSRYLENAKSGTYRPMMMPHRSDPHYLEALKTPKIVNTVRLFCKGEPVVGLQTEFFFCKPGTPGFSLHQDNFFVEANYGVFLSAWIALTDTYPENGGLIVYPGTHRESLLPVAKKNVPASASQDPNANSEECLVPDQYSAINVSVPKGSALFIHGNLVHGSNTNVSGDFRYVLLCTYIKMGEKFRVGKYAQRNIVELA